VGREIVIGCDLLFLEGPCDPQQYHSILIEEMQKHGASPEDIEKIDPECCCSHARNLVALKEAVSEFYDIYYANLLLFAFNLMLEEQQKSFAARQEANRRYDEIVMTDVLRQEILAQVLRSIRLSGEIRVAEIMRNAVRADENADANAADANTRISFEEHHRVEFSEPGNEEKLLAQLGLKSLT
jgi:hypothetical protein